MSLMVQTADPSINNVNPSHPELFGLFTSRCLKTVVESCRGQKKLKKATGWFGLLQFYWLASKVRWNFGGASSWVLWESMQPEPPSIDASEETGPHLSMSWSFDRVGHHVSGIAAAISHAVNLHLTYEYSGSAVLSVPRQCMTQRANRTHMLQRLLNIFGVALPFLSPPTSETEQQHDVPIVFKTRHL